MKIADAELYNTINITRFTDCDFCKQKTENPYCIYPEHFACESCGEKLMDLQAAFSYLRREFLNEKCFTLPNGDCIGFNCPNHG